MISLKLNYLCLFFGVAVSVSVQAQTTLSQKATFYRCYSQLTGTHPPLNSPHLARVISGTDAIQVCLDLFNQVELSDQSNTFLPPSRTVEHVKILNHFHRIHNDWFEYKGHFNIGASLRSDTRKMDIYDNSEPALYYTRSLFSPAAQAVPVDSVVRSSVHLRAQRTTIPTAGLFSAATASSYIYDTLTPFAHTGDLLGITEAPDVAYPYTSTRTSPAFTGTGTHRLFYHFGGGAMGNGTYVLKSLRAAEGFLADGGLRTPRTWAKVVFKDFLCRELPIARPSDTSMFIVPESSLPFRQGASCTQCHASMDRLASVIRNVKYTSYPGGGIWNRYGPWVADFHAPSGIPSEAGWPSEGDTSFHLRPSKGTLFFRNIHGNLVDIPVNSLAEVGQHVAQTDDFYTCVASRYYEHFTGIKIKLGDPGTAVLAPDVQKHYDRVLQLGLSLKTHKNPRSTIAEILQHSDYKKSDFGYVEETP